MSKPKVIAFYLPQYYPIPENDKWWGPGFSEWTNVAKARPLFPGHYQPIIPGELGFYDLRLEETREAQVKLAKEAGIDAFCYWHYWSNGKRLLERVFEEVVKTGKPDFPFCLCWANHSWYKKSWSAYKKDVLLSPQEYGGKEDYKNHFYTLLEAFKDPRYYKIDNKPVFGIFDPIRFEEIQTFINTWNHLAKENGLNEFWFFGYTSRARFVNRVKENGIKNIVLDFASEVPENKNILARKIYYFGKKYLNLPFPIKYSSYCKEVIKYLMKDDSVFPSVMPNFDHSPRANYKSIILYGSNPSRWKKFITDVIQIMSKRPKEENIIFIKAWNEWGEGNYMEPDLKFGKGYIKALAEVLKEFDN